jgi:ketosteroid isomerase-like protein
MFAAHQEIEAPMNKTIIAMIAALCVAALPATAAGETPTPEQILAEARAKIAAAIAATRAAAKTPEEKAVVEADLAFAADAKKRGAGVAFTSAAHPDAKMFPPRQPVAMGPEGVGKLFAGDKSLWEWAPVQVSASGDLGVTWGIAAISGTGEDGKPFAVTTRYVSVWRKGTDGTWKFWLDVGTPGPLPDVK